MALDVATAAESLRSALAGITGLRAFAFVPDSIAPPAAVVDLDEIVYNDTMSSGCDRAMFFVTVAVGKMVDRAAHAQVAAYLSGTGGATTAVKAALNAIGSHVQVMRAEKSEVTFASQQFLGATFDVDWIQ